MYMSSTHKGLFKTVSIILIDSIFIHLLLSLYNYIQLNEEILLLYYNNRYYVQQKKSHTFVRVTHYTRNYVRFCTVEVTRF